MRKPAGYVCYQRPAYQAPGAEQAVLALPTQAAVVTVATAGTGPHAWPIELAQRMQALRDSLPQAARPLSSVQVAAGFRRVRPEKGGPLLATLAVLSLMRQTAEGAYVV